MQEYLKLAQAIALEAGGVMQGYFRLGLQHVLKDDNSPVTAADTEIQQLVIMRLSAAYPEHSLYGEEGTEFKDSSPYTWVFDPIDGTAAFLRGVPTNVFSIALVENGVPILGVVYDPYLQRLYHAVRGEGAYMNDEPIHVASRTELAQSYIEIDGHKGFKNARLVELAVQEKVRILSYSSTIYAQMLVATGQLDGVVFPLKNPWDCAAGKVIIEEAGGAVSDLQGKDQRYDAETTGFVAGCTPEFHAKLLELISPSL